MPTDYGYKLAREINQGRTTEQLVRVTEDAIKAGKLRREELSFGELFSSLLARNQGNEAGARKLKDYLTGRLREGIEATDASTFSNITGQLLVTIVKEQYDNPELIGRKLVKVIPAGQNLRDHKVPYVSPPLQLPQPLLPLEEYPFSTFIEQWVTLPAPVKIGQALAVPMEAVVADLTGQVTDQAKALGKLVAYDNEVRIARTVMGLSQTYTFNGNSTANVYKDSTAETGFGYVNALTGQTVSNWTHFNTMEQLFSQMTDPATGRPIVITPKVVICMPEKRYEIKTILKATEVRRTVPGYATSNNPLQTVSPNPLETDYQVLSSPIWRRVLIDSGVVAANAAEYVWLGDPKEAFAMREVYGPQSETAPPGNPAYFQQDIAILVKAGSYNQPGIYDPRYMVRSINS